MYNRPFLHSDPTSIQITQSNEVQALVLRWTVSKITVICNLKTQDGARGAFHLGKISDWKFRKPSGSNGKAFLPTVEIAAVCCCFVSRNLNPNRAHNYFEQMPF